MFSSTCLSALALSILLLPSSARVLWVPEDFDPQAGSSLLTASLLTARDTATCSGDKSLIPCGGSLPSDFCCPSGTTCLALSTSAFVTAAICCPEGQDCTRISPVSCNVSLQNTTNTQLHVSPPQQLKSCGNQCCPMGYSCKNDQCIARTAPTPVAQATPTSTATGSGTSSPTSTSTNAGVEPGFGDPNATETDSDFNGKSFAAGFIPGIAIGAFIAACIILCCIRKKRKSSTSYVDEKPRDTLTDLGTIDGPATMHGRNISEPKADPSAGYRTDFLRHSPPRPDANRYPVDIRSPASGPVTPSDSPPKIKALFTRSPFMAQPPSSPPSGQPHVPAHLKRGTLSFKISPVRALKKQKSTHSLRRQMTESSQAVRTNSRKPHLSRSASTETIQVLMPSNEPYTPDRPHPIPESAETLGTSAYQPQKSAHSTWDSSTTDVDDTPDERQQPGSHAPYAYASSSRYPSDVQPLHITPTRPPVPRLPTAATTGGPYGWLASPYTPTKEAGGTKKTGGLAPPGSDHRRDTTFSAMMERAGLRKSDLLVGTGNRKKQQA